MSDKKTLIGDRMLEAQVRQKSNTLNISLDDLIERYVKRGLFFDDYYEPPKRTREELIEMGKKAVEKDKKRGIPPKKHNFDVFVGRWNKVND